MTTKQIPLFVKYADRGVTPFNPTEVPAAYSDVDAEAYHAGVGLSSSGLKHFIEGGCPKKFFHEYLAPSSERNESPNLLRGKAIHTAVLEPAKYFKTYYPLPEKYDRRTKQGKSDYEYHEEIAKLKGLTLVDCDTHNLAQAIAAEVHADQFSAHLLGENALCEQSLYWVDEETDVLCKCRPDKMIMIDGRLWCLDLKSTENAGERSFRNSCLSYNYDLSAAFYLRGLRAVHAEDVEIGGFILCAYEKEPPYASAFYRISASDIYESDGRVGRALSKAAECFRTGKYDGYHDGVRELSIKRSAPL